MRTIEESIAVLEKWRNRNRVARGWRMSANSEGKLQYSVSITMAQFPYWERYEGRTLISALNKAIKAASAVEQE